MATTDSAEHSTILVAEHNPDDQICPHTAASPAAPATETDSLAAAVSGNDGETSTLAPEPAQRTEMIEPSDTPGVSAVVSIKKWPGWPGDCVFRLVVPVTKVGSIIGRKGDVIKKMCEDTKARIRILDGAVGTSDRIVLISGKEEIEAPLSPAMDALLRVFKRISGLAESNEVANDSATAGAESCSVRLLLSSTQAISLIGKQGTVIKSMRESTGTSMRVLSGDEVPLYAAADERIVELQGDTLKVLKALEAVVGHLRKFLVDRSVIPLFEKPYNDTVSKESKADAWADKSSLNTASQTGLVSEYSLSAKRESLFHDRDIHLESRFQPSGVSLDPTSLGIRSSGFQHSGVSLDPTSLGIRSSGLQPSGVSLDPTTLGIRSSGLGRTGASFITQITQTMQIPLSYAEDIIGVGGSNIAFIRRTSGAILTIQESRGLPDEITVEIKGTTSQVQLAQQLIQEAMSNDRDPITSRYGRAEYGPRLSSYSNVGSSYPSSMSSQSYDDHGYSGYGGGYTSFRL